LMKPHYVCKACGKYKRKDVLKKAQ
jgi:ribosomal protein L32